MTQEVLVQIIFLLCNGLNTGSFGSNGGGEVLSKEARVVCFEDYVNCAVGTGGKIMSMVDFKDKCILKEKKK